MLFIYVSFVLVHGVTHCCNGRSPLVEPPVERDSPSSRVISKCAEKTMLGTVKGFGETCSSKTVGV